MTKRINIITYLTISSCLFVITTSIYADRIIYVDADANGLNNGTSWADAYNDVNDAFADANSTSEPLEFWIAGEIIDSNLFNVNADSYWPEHKYKFIIDQIQSNVTVELVVSTFLGTRSDSDTSPVAGWVEAALTPPDTKYSPFSVIHVNDLNMNLTEDISLYFNFGFGMYISAVGSDMSISMSDPGPPAQVLEDGSFEAYADMLLKATMQFEVFGGSYQMDVCDVTMISYIGVVSETGQTIELIFDIEGEYQIPEGDLPAGVQSITVYYSGNAVAQATTVFWNRADLNCDGIINLDDLFWLSEQWLLNALRLLADIDGDENVRFSDFAFMANHWLMEH